MHYRLFLGKDGEKIFAITGVKGHFGKIWYAKLVTRHGTQVYEQNPPPKNGANKKEVEEIGHYYEEISWDEFYALNPKCIRMIDILDGSPTAQGIEAEIRSLGTPFRKDTISHCFPKDAWDMPATSA